MAGHSKVGLKELGFDDEELREKQRALVNTVKRLRIP